MNIADLVLVIVIVLVFGAAVYGIVKNGKNGKHCSGCGGACSGCRYAEEGYCFLRAGTQKIL